LYKIDDEEPKDSIEQVKAPTGEIVRWIINFLDFTREVCFIPDEKLELKSFCDNIEGLELVEAIVVDRDEEEENGEAHIYTRLSLQFHADSAKYNINQAEGQTLLK